MTIDWTKPIETVPCERNPNPVPCEFAGISDSGDAEYFIRGDWFARHGGNQIDSDGEDLPWTDNGYHNLPKIRNVETPAIDWTKPLELMDGTPIRLSDRNGKDFGGTNPDRDGDYWIEREDGLPTDLGPGERCVSLAGTFVQTIRNRAEPAATPTDDEIPQHIYKRVGEVELFQSGATLRDQFAMAALTGILAGADVNMDVDELVKQAYWAADAMMQARK